jgi:hypothetical protein
LIVDVICHHAAVTYSHIGGWYYLDGPKPGLTTTVLLASFETFNQAFFMGFLFLIAGYFVPRAFDTKGYARFLGDRAFRLGIPSLFFVFVLDPLTVYGLLSASPLLSGYLRFLTSRKVLYATGPMWFAVALLIFCAVYALFRVAYRKPPVIPALPGHKAVAGLIFLMAGCSFLVRILQPIGTNVFSMQLCYFSQYVLLFGVGILAYRGNWLLQVPQSFGLFWLRLALMIGVPAWFAILALSGALGGNSQSLLGGIHWQSAALCLWESFFCVGVCLGLTVIFRERFDGQGRFAKWMSRNSFSAYLFHTPLLVTVTLSLRNLPAPPLLKFAVASLLAVPITFAVSAFLRRRMPLLRRAL